MPTKDNTSLQPTSHKPPLQSATNRTVWTFSSRSAASRADSIQIIISNVGLESLGQLTLYSTPQAVSPNPAGEFIIAGHNSTGFGNFALSSSTNTRYITHIVLQNVVGFDYFGIRVSLTSSLSYTTSNPVSWSGARRFCLIRPPT